MPPKKKGGSGKKKKDDNAEPPHDPSWERVRACSVDWCYALMGTEAD